MSSKGSTSAATTIVRMRMHDPRVPVCAQDMPLLGVECARTTMAPDEFILEPGVGKLVQLGHLGVRFMLDGTQTGGRFALVEHPLPARSLGSAIHTHHDEDEFSFVLEGDVGFQIGDRVLVATPGTLVTKPRDVPHAFWNAGDVDARILELISPAGFENYFAAMAELFSSGERDRTRASALQQEYHLEMDFSSIARLTETYGLTL